MRRRGGGEVEERWRRVEGGGERERGIRRGREDREEEEGREKGITREGAFQDICARLDHRKCNDSLCNEFSQHQPDSMLIIQKEKEKERKQIKGEILIIKNQEKTGRGE